MLKTGHNHDRRLKGVQMINVVSCSMCEHIQPAIVNNKMAAS